MSVALGFDHVSKRYQIRSSRRSLGDLLWKHIGRSRILAHQDAVGPDAIWALKDVSFELCRGNVLGIIGHNGAGKTTVLKLLSGVTRPTSGSFCVDGRVSALIELGAGFHPDLTGRENVYLNGVILGLSRREIDRRFRSIVEFAELEAFIDTPVKRYSSGMYARLGFAVAAHVDPDVLLVDEVLAVGDINFQRKCHEFIHRFATSGRTAVFISHNLFVMEQLCNHLVWLQHGIIEAEGPPGRILPAYLDYMDEQMLASSDMAAESTEPVSIGEVAFLDAEGRERDTFRTGEDVVVCIRYRANYQVKKPHFCLGVGPVGAPPLFLASMLADGNAPALIMGDGVVRCILKATPLLPRTYDVWGEVWSEDQTLALVTWRRLARFRVIESTVDRDLRPRGGIRHLRADAPVRVSYEWQY